MSLCRVTCQGYIKAKELTTVDLVELARKILSEEIRRPEFYVEICEDSGHVIGSMNAGPLYPADSDSLPDRWCLTYADPADEEGRWCLAGQEPSRNYRWYVFCGAESQILDCCAVPFDIVLGAIRQCCTEGGRSESLRWIDVLEGMNLD